MGSCDAAVCYDINLPFIWCKSPTLQLVKATPITEPPACFMVGVLRGVGLQLFYQLLTTHRLSYLTPKFRILIHQSKGLYPTALLFSFCALWPNGAFWYWFDSTVVSWQQFCHIKLLFCWPALQSLLIIVNIDTFFSTLVQLFSDVWSSQPSVMQPCDW